MLQRYTVIPLIALFAAVVSLLFGKTLSVLPALSVLWPAFELTVLLAAVFAAVYHAEHIAHALGEPFGTLVLTMSVTVIECALILSIMLSGESAPSLARDTTMAVLMIILNLIVGLCIVSGGLRYGEQGFRVPGARSYLMVLVPFSVLTLILPNYTSSRTGPFYSPSQIVFVSVVTLALYAMFLYVQTVRHKDYFLAESEAEEAVTAEAVTAVAVTALPPGSSAAPAPGSSSLPAEAGLAGPVALLLVALTAVVLLSKGLSPSIEGFVAHIGAPRAVIGLLVATLVLLPESIAALNAARQNRLQTAINLALGSSLATIGLTIPAVGLLSLWLDVPLVLGLEPSHTLLLVLTLITSILTFGTGRTNILPGFIHLMLMAVFFFLLFEP